MVTWWWGRQQAGLRCPLMPLIRSGADWWNVRWMQDFLQMGGHGLEGKQWAGTKSPVLGSLYIAPYKHVSSAVRSQVWRAVRAHFALEPHLSTKFVSWGLSCWCWATSTLAPTNNHSLQDQVLMGAGASSVCGTVM